MASQRKVLLKVQIALHQTGSTNESRTTLAMIVEELGTVIR